MRSREATPDKESASDPVAGGAVDGRQGVRQNDANRDRYQPGENNDAGKLDAHAPP